MSVGDGRRAVAIGGGTGLPQVLRCLVDQGFETTAVVTMADDGGSSGILRQQLGMLPPGDIRNCLVALAEQPDGIASQLFQYRFPGGEGLAGHALGNLIIAALADITGSFPDAIAFAGGYLGVRGRVLPSTLADVRLHGVDRSGSAVSGQARLARNPHAIAKVQLEPFSPPAYAPAVDAIAEADVVVLGPGSLYTSLIPNVLVGGIARALRESTARRIYVCNVANMRGETGGLDAYDHVKALGDHGLEGSLDAVLVHVAGPDCPQLCDDGGLEPVEAGPATRERIAKLGIEVVSADLADREVPAHHDRTALCSALEGMVG